MYSAVTADQRTNPLNVSTVQFGQGSVLQNQRYHRMLVPNLLQNLRTGAVSALCLFSRRETQFFKQNRSELCRRVHIEFFSAEFIDLSFYSLYLSAQAVADFLQRTAIHGNSLDLHACENRNQRKLNFEAEFFLSVITDLPLLKTSNKLHIPAPLRAVFLHGLQVLSQKIHLAVRFPEFLLRLNFRMQVLK